MSCERCRDVVERPEVPHVIRRCEACGREMRVVDPGQHGRGIQIKAGDRFVMPTGWLKLSFNPLKSSGRFSRWGLEWFAKFIFLQDMAGKEEEYATEAAALERYADDILSESSLLPGLDINTPEHVERIAAIIGQNQSTREFWAFWVGQFLAIARDARGEGHAERAAWATACAERSRSMLIFKEHLEEVVWMGQSAKRLIDMLAIWDAHKENNDEGFWQATFNENSYVLSQVFAVPVLFIQERAYVGGMKVDRSEARFVDYLFSAESSREAILIEIKTPTSKLLGAEYRGGTYAPSAELSGALVQALGYRTELIQNLRAITEGSKLQLSAFSPKCVLLAGNSQAQLTDESKRKSFELFRATLRDVEVITYDELFRKVEILAELFGLTRAGPSTLQ